MHSPTHNLPTCAVIITTYNNVPGLQSCLNALAKQTLHPNCIYIADDGSKKETADFLKSYVSKTQLKHIWHEDRGYRRSAILNATLSAVSEEYVIFIDGDEIPHHRFVKDHLEFARHQTVALGTRCGLLGLLGTTAAAPSPLGLLYMFLSGRVINDSFAIEVSSKTRLIGLLKGLRLPFSRYKASSVKETHGGNLAAWKKDITQINGYDADFEGWGAEDADFVWRLGRIGVHPYQIQFRAICFHMEGTLKAINKEKGNKLDKNRPVVCANGIRQCRDFSVLK